MPRLTLSTILALLSLMLRVHAEFPEANCETISFTSGRETFAGYVYKPEGNGPFPTVIWLHGHADHLTKTGSSEYRDLAKLYTREGFVLFIPDRHVHDISRSDYSVGLQKLLEQSPKSSATKEKRFLEDTEINARDVTAAVEWLKRQSYVDTAKLTLSGWSSGAAAGLTLSPKRKDFRALVLFSPGLTQWDGNEAFQSKLTQSASACQCPVFLVGATDENVQNFFTVLEKALKDKTGCKAQQYPHGGYDGKQRHSLAINDCDTWGYDVLRFIELAIKD
jgi:dienelactone hydrolase